MEISQNYFITFTEATKVNAFNITTVESLKDYSKDFIYYCDASKSTIATYKKSLKVFFEYLSINGIEKPTREDLITYRKALEEKGLQATTIASYINAMKQFFKWTNLKGYYKDISIHVKSARVDNNNYRKDPLTSEQVNKLLTTLKERATTTESKRDYAILELALGSGLRTIEIARANFSDIMLKNETLVIAIQGKGKQDKNEYQDINNNTYNAILSYMNTRHDIACNSPLFVSESDKNKGQRLTTRSISRIIKKAFKLIGIDTPNITAHSTRHTYATELLKHLPIEIVSKLMRHSSINTTMIYTHTQDKLSIHASEILSKSFHKEVKND